MLRYVARVEAAIKAVREAVERATRVAIDRLARYTERVYRLSRDVLVDCSKIVWNLAKVSVVLLAPAYVTSFGDELRRANGGIALATLAWFILLVGLGGMLTVGLTLVIAPLGGGEATTTPDSANPPLESAEVTDSVSKHRSTSGYAFVLFDCLSVGAVGAIMSFWPQYVFQSPLLATTQGALLTVPDLVRPVQVYFEIRR